jgi:hypothetical protein
MVEEVLKFKRLDGSEAALRRIADANFAGGCRAMAGQALSDIHEVGGPSRQWSLSLLASRVPLQSAQFGGFRTGRIAVSSSERSRFPADPGDPRRSSRRPLLQLIRRRV